MYQAMTTIGRASAIQEMASHIPLPKSAESSPTALTIAITTGMLQIWQSDRGRLTGAPRVASEAELNNHAESYVCRYETRTEISTPPLYGQRIDRNPLVGLCT